jgi:hypothetical protein
MQELADSTVEHVGKYALLGLAANAGKPNE